MEISIIDSDSPCGLYTLADCPIGGSKCDVCMKLLEEAETVYIMNNDCT